MSRSRFAACVALLAAVGVVLALVLLLVRDLVALGEVIVALAVAGAAGWLALTRRGVLRVVGVGVVLIALAGAAAALFVQDAINELVTLAVALAVFAVAARMALRRTPERAGSADLGSAVRKAGRDGFVLLMNPRSGGG